MTYVIRILFTLLVFSYWIGGLFSFSFIEAPLLLVYVLFSLYMAIYFIVRNNWTCSLLMYKWFFVLVFLNVFLLLLVTFFIGSNTFFIPSFLYELYKLYIFIFAFGLMIYNFEDNIKFCISVLRLFLFLNLIVLIVQNFYSVDVLKYIGIRHDISYYAVQGRPTGITQNANIIGTFALECFIFGSILHAKEVSKAKGVMVLSALCVLFSSSKASLALLIAFICFGKISLVRFMLLSVIFVVICSLLYTFNIFSIQLKLKSYMNFIELLIDGSIITLDNTEARLYFWYEAVSMFFSNPFGSGYGTWGDFSSSFNPYVVSSLGYTKITDSSLSHVLVEQGIFTLIYLASIYCFIPSDRLKAPAYSVFLILMFTNMGFSQSLFYLGFWLIILAAYYKKERVD